MRKLLGIVILPLMPLVWLIELFFWPSIYGPRIAPWRHAAEVWNYWKMDFWKRKTRH